jgi:hypothetical protein
MQLHHHNITSNMLSMTALFFFAVLSLVRITDAFTLNRSPMFARNLYLFSTIGESVKTYTDTDTVRELEPIVVDQSRELSSISDANFNDNVLLSQGLSVVFFTS